MMNKKKLTTTDNKNNRDSFIFYRSYYEAINQLPSDVKLQIYEAIAEYSLNFNLIELSGIPNAIFILIKPQIEANQKRFLNGSKPKQKQNRSKTGAKNDQNKSKLETNVNVNVNDNENTNANNNENTNTSTGLAFYFNSIFSNYPKHRVSNKTKLIEFWKSNFLDSKIKDIEKGFKYWLVSEEWEKENGKFIPNIYRFITEEMYLAIPNIDDMYLDHVKKELTEFMINYNDGFREKAIKYDFDEINAKF